MDDLRLLTIREAAELMGVSVTKFRGVVDAGDVDVVAWGNERRVPVWSLRSWQERMTQATRHDLRVLQLINPVKGQAHG